jgi:hypothetical protein
MTDNTEFEKRVSELLTDSSNSLDGRTQSRLTQARHAALDQLHRPRSAIGAWRQWAPTGAVAAAVLVTVFYVGQRGAVDVNVVARAGSGLDDLELLADSDTYALSADADQDLDADFYEWAAASAPDGPST